MAQMTREEVEQTVRAARPLRGRDLRGIRLEGADLQGAPCAPIC